MVYFISCFGDQFFRTSQKSQRYPQFALHKGIHMALRFQIPNSGSQISSCGLHSIQIYGLWIPYDGFWISSSGFQIPKPRICWIPDSFTLGYTTDVKTPPQRGEQDTLKDPKSYWNVICNRREGILDWTRQLYSGSTHPRSLHYY